jgi:hypothetical protein
MAYAALAGVCATVSVVAFAAANCMS